MKKLMIVTSSIIVASLIPFKTFAELIVQDLSLNGDRSTTVTVIPEDINVAISRYNFSYDIDQIVYGNQYQSAKHVIDKLSLQDQAKILIFWSNALIEKKLDPMGVPKQQLSLKKIIEMSDVDVDSIETVDDYNALLYQKYREKFNKTIPIEPIEILGTKLTFNIKNYSGYKLESIHGVLSILDKDTKALKMLVNINKDISLMPKKEMNFSVDMNKYYFKQINNDDVVYSFSLDSACFSQIGNFDIDSYYKKRLDLRKEMSPSLKNYYIQ